MGYKIISFILIISLLFTSCTTKELWGNKTYKESLEQFLINDETNELVVIGKKYHYIFKIDYKLKEILKSHKREKLKAFFEDFKITSNNIIKGKYILYYDTKSKINDRDISWFKFYGFEPSKANPILSEYYNVDVSYMKIGTLIGTRYLAKEKIVTEDSFTNNYCIRIEENEYKYDEDTRIKNTPITVTVDGVVIAATTALIVLAVSGGANPFTGGGVVKHGDLPSVNKYISCKEKKKSPEPFYLVF